MTALARPAALLCTLLALALLPACATTQDGPSKPACCGECGGDKACCGSCSDCGDKAKCCGSCGGDKAKCCGECGGDKDKAACCGECGGSAKSHDHDHGHSHDHDHSHSHNTHSHGGNAEGVIPTAVLVNQIEATHNTAAYLGKDAVKADIVVDFGGNILVEGTMWTTPAVGKTRFELADGTVIVFDGSTCWVSPESAATPMARFHALTWPYFVALPHKMTEPGVNLQSIGDYPAAGERMPAVKMTFDAGVGDAPDDWYIVFPDAAGVVQAASYIVTYGKDAEEAGKSTSIILYDGYEVVDGVPLSTQWVFGYWDKDSGMTSVKGTAALSNVAFVSPPASAFRAPAGAVEVAAP
ncbi:MAG: hypothetical protein AAF078_10580 [Planctomycetota bacterium]